MLFTKRQESELITALKGRGEIPLKFVYLGEGAKKWAVVTKNRLESGGINSIETTLLKKRALEFINTFSNFKEVNIVDIGCGDGTPCIPIIEKLKEKNIPFTYVPIDISKEMLDLAVETVTTRFKGTKCKPFQLDFELGQFSDIIYNLKKEGSVNLMMFLGSTLGNFSDRSRVLTNFRDSMTSDDFLIVGVELTNFAKIDKVLTHYKGKVPEDLLYAIPEIIGMKKSDTEYSVSWNERESQVECFAILKKNVNVHIGSEKFLLEKGERILLCRSVKFTEWVITKLLSDTGFRTELLTTAPDRGYILSMIQPTRYSI
ncbi:MAG: L-histidine N(alpha)-methyltransferase [Candidatus Pacearchaeota archaeon]|jgi:uncharacterized SAM-dependent methyltransferase